MKKFLMVCVSMSLISCSHIEALRNKDSSVSYVAKEISDSDSETIGEDMAKFLASQYPAAKTTIYVEPSKTVVRSVLAERLTETGFGIVETRSDQGAAIMGFQYFVTPLDNGVLVRMRYGDRMASRYYARSPDGALSASGKIAVREVKK